MTRWIEELVPDELTDGLLDFLADPCLREPLPVSGALPDDYATDFSRSRLVRVRRGAVSASIFGASSTMLALHKGSAALEEVRLASAFFGKGQFVGEGPTRDGDAWVLRQTLRGPYYQPLPPEHRRADGDWSRMDRARRRESEVQSLVSTVRIREEAGRFEITTEVTGTDQVPVAIELAVRPGGELAGVVPVPGVSDAWLLADGHGEYRAAGKVIRFGPGHAAHRWTALRGALPKLDLMSVYLTGFTPYRSTLTVA